MLDIAEAPRRAPAPIITPSPDLEDVSEHDHDD
jgi:hypothetical protein